MAAPTRKAQPWSLANSNPTMPVFRNLSKTPTSTAMITAVYQGQDADGAILPGGESGGPLKMAFQRRISLCRDLACKTSPELDK